MESDKLTNRAMAHTSATISIKPKIKLAYEGIINSLIVPSEPRSVFSYSTSNTNRIILNFAWPMNLNSILLRYNHQANGDHDRWRFVHNDLETPCASVTFLCASETIEQEVLVNGELVSKWHIRPINPTEIIQKQDEKGIHFIIH